MNPLAPWGRPGRLFRAAAHVAIGLPVAIITFVVIVVMTALSIGLMPVFLLGIPIALADVRWRPAAWPDSNVPRGGAFRRTIPDSVAPLTRTSWFGRLGERLRSKPRWREIAHHLLQLPVCVISYALVAAAWCGALAMALLPAYVGTFPDDTAKFYFFEIDATDPTRWLAMAVGVIGILFVAPWVTIGAASVQWALADRLLGPTEDERLAEQVTDLQSRRTAAVDSAESERRRIERDLHDGAQQRLVALAADLGCGAATSSTTTPRQGAELVADGPRGGQGGVERDPRPRARHPSGDPRGPRARRRAVGGRRPVAGPGRRSTSRSPSARRRPSRARPTSSSPRRSTNVARHSRRDAGQRLDRPAGDRLVVEIRDNGHGGADASKGTGPARTA